MTDHSIDVETEEEREAYRKTMEIFRLSNHRRIVAALKFGSVGLYEHSLRAPSAEGTQIITEFLTVYEKIVNHIKKCKNSECALKNGNNNKK